jgi:5-hydroxyisourate hydrolase
MARLSTHVLDTAHGRPAQGVAIDLHVLRKERRVHLKSTVTNADGRTDEPLLSAESLETGVYELTFGAGDYFRAAAATVSSPAFLDEVVIRFGISEPTGNYHVPLLLSPYGYSTYRGS